MGQNPEYWPGTYDQPDSEGVGTWLSEETHMLLPSDAETSYRYPYSSVPFYLVIYIFINKDNKVIDINIYSLTNSIYTCSIDIH